MTFTPRGAQVIYLGGYKYHKHQTTGNKIRWHCATHQKKRCKASIMTDSSLKQILKFNHEHNHCPPPTSNGVAEPIFTKSKRGANIILLNGYKFHKHSQSGEKTRWQCSTYKCKAHIWSTTNTNEIISLQNKHFHIPNEFGCKRKSVTKSGEE